MTRAAAFDLVGPMGHFRKFYTNSSSLTYGFPPRTTLMGIVAAILGRERDTYYEELNLGRYAVVISSPTRRLLQTVNHIRTKSEDFSFFRLEKAGPWPGTQTPMELLLPGRENMNLRFRIFFSHPQKGLVQEVGERAQGQRPCYPLYLGLTECLAMIEGLGQFDIDELDRLEPGAEVATRSVVSINVLDDLVLAPGQEGVRGTTTVVRERVPFAFKSNRALSPPVSVIHSTGGDPLRVRLTCSAYRFHLGSGEPDTFAFLEE